MADIATIWDPVGARGDWRVGSPADAIPAQALQLAEGGPLQLAGGGDLMLSTPQLGVSKNVDLVSDQDLMTSVLISLFTDRAAAPDDVIPDGTTDPRGWWGDASQDGSLSLPATGAPAKTYPIGSRLWLLGAAKAVHATLLKARGYIAEALQWLIDDGVASAIDVFCEWTRPNMLGARITLWQPSGPPKVFSFANVWSQLANAPAAPEAAGTVTAAPGPAPGQLDFRRPGNPLGRIIR